MQISHAQAIDALFTMVARLSRLIATLTLAVAVLALLLAALAIWLATTPAGVAAAHTVQATFVGWPEWLLGLIGLGGIAAALRVGYRWYHKAAEAFLSEYTMKGLGK